MQPTLITPDRVQASAKSWTLISEFHFGRDPSEISIPFSAEYHGTLLHIVNSR